ncbi:hypothetical protein INR49_010448 [Caranx melampygus]|nr:hypothetical protein INR49_010448 [Caranx melampygus]
MLEHLSHSDHSHEADLSLNVSVFTVTEETDGDDVTLTCSVLPDEMCPVSVRWLYQGEDVGDRSDVSTSQLYCGASVTFHKSHQLYGSSSNFLSCEVLHDASGQPLTFSLKTSPGETGEEETTATDIRVEAVHWSLIAVSVGAAVLIIIIIVVVIVIMIVNVSIAPGV